jgi:hypothetical protein
MYSAKIGDKNMDIKAKNMIFDTGSSLNYVPTDEFQ